MRKRKKTSKQRKKGLDRVSRNSPRGRRPSIPGGTVVGRADNFRTALGHIWPNAEKPLLKAKSPAKVARALRLHGEPFADRLIRYAKSIFDIIHDHDFPKRAKARYQFIADSLGGRPDLTFRSSRDACGRERARLKGKTRHRILRHEFYVECSCGYKGPARDNACRKCGTGIDFLPESLAGAPLVSL